MLDIHNTSIQKGISDIFELNAFDEQIQKAHNILTPTLNIEPVQDFLLNLTSDGDTTFVCPVDVDIFVKGVQVTCSEAAEDGGCAIDVSGVLENCADVKKFASLKIGESNGGALTSGQSAVFVSFAGRGLKLARGSTITLNSDANADDAIITGYFGSGRS